MIDLKLDMKEFDRAAQAIGASINQVPFALSVAMNEAAKKTRLHLINTTWLRSVTVRNRSFMRAALLTNFSHKSNLRVQIYDALGRASLKLHDTGGTKVSQRGRLAIPGTVIKRQRGSRGVPISLRPRNLPNSFRKGNAIYQRQGKNAVLMYVLKSSARIDADVPFSEDFQLVMRQEITRAFPIALRGAMSTRRK